MFDLAGTSLGQHDLFAWLLAGLPCPEKIVKVEVEGAQPEDLFYPTAWLPERTLDIFGRICPREKLRLSLTTLRDGKPATQELGVGRRPPAGRRLRRPPLGAAEARPVAATAARAGAARSSPCRKSGPCSRPTPRSWFWRTSSSTRNGESTASSDTAIGSRPTRGRRRRSRRSGSPARLTPPRSGSASRKSIPCAGHSLGPGGPRPGASGAGRPPVGPRPQIAARGRVARICRTAASSGGRTASARRWCGRSSPTGRSWTRCFKRRGHRWSRTSGRCWPRRRWSIPISCGGIPTRGSCSRSVDVVPLLWTEKPEAGGMLPAEKPEADGKTREATDWNWLDDDSLRPPRKRVFKAPAQEPSSPRSGRPPRPPKAISPWRTSPPCSAEIRI